MLELLASSSSSRRGADIGSSGNALNSGHLEDIMGIHREREELEKRMSTLKKMVCRLTKDTCRLVVSRPRFEFRMVTLCEARYRTNIFPDRNTRVQHLHRAFRARLNNLWCRNLKPKNNHHTPASGAVVPIAAAAIKNTVSMCF